MTSQPQNDANFLEQATNIIAAYVSNNSLTSAQLPELIANVHRALKGLGIPTTEPTPEPLKPAVPVRRSVLPDYIVCLEDGLKFKSLKRHLRTKYNITPEEYRSKWGLPNDYPMVAPNYAAARSNLAKQMGLGQQRKKPVAPAPKTRGRKKAPAPVPASAEG